MRLMMRRLPVLFAISVSFIQGCRTRSGESDSKNAHVAEAKTSPNSNLGLTGLAANPSDNRAVGLLKDEGGICTAAQISVSYILTADHCNGSAQYYFVVDDEASILDTNNDLPGNPAAFVSSRASLGTFLFYVGETGFAGVYGAPVGGLGIGDLSLLRIRHWNTVKPTDNPPMPMIAPSEIPPSNGDIGTIYGYGPEAGAYATRKKAEISANGSVIVSVPPYPFPIGTPKFKTLSELSQAIPGDSGGPIVMGGKIVSTTSGGFGGMNDDVYGSKVSKFFPHIIQTILGENSSAEFRKLTYNAIYSKNALGYWVGSLGFDENNQPENIKVDYEFLEVPAGGTGTQGILHYCTHARYTRGTNSVDGAPMCGQIVTASVGQGTSANLPVDLKYPKLLVSRRDFDKTHIELFADLIFEWGGNKYYVHSVKYPAVISQEIQ